MTMGGFVGVPCFVLIALKAEGLSHLGLVLELGSNVWVGTYLSIRDSSLEWRNTQCQVLQKVLSSQCSVRLLSLIHNLHGYIGI